MDIVIVLAVVLTLVPLAVNDCWGGASKAAVGATNPEPPAITSTPTTLLPFPRTQVPEPVPELKATVGAIV